MTDDNDVEEQGERIQGLSIEVGELFERQNTRADNLDGVQKEIGELANELGVPLEAVDTNSEERPSQLVTPYDLAAAAGSLDEDTRSKLDSEFLSSAPAVPPMDALDRFIIVTVGCMAALADFILVGMPPDTKWTPSFERSVVPTGWLSERVKSWNVGNNNWLARQCMVPFDKSTFPGTDIGFSPFNHRALSFGHDPSPLGFVIGMMDIASGRLTGIEHDGYFFSAQTDVPDLGSACLGPLLWLGHLISDVATPMGIPVPGTSLLELMQIRVPGVRGDPTVADVARVLYQQGYDFRHYLVGGVVPALVEGLIRLYDWLRFSNSDDVERDGVRAQLAENYVADARKNARLASRLFWAHAIASGANAGRITIQAVATEDFFSAARNINLAEWEMFTIRTIQYVKALTRDTDLDQVLANRRKLEERWDSLVSDGGSAQVLYDKPSEAVPFKKVNL